MKKKTITRIGQGGIETSFVARKSTLRAFVGGDKTCQESIDDEIDNKTHWLQLKQMLQNISGKGIATIVAALKGKDADVIVKIQTAENARHEFEFQTALTGLKGFIQFDCLFMCGGDREYIERFGYFNDKSRLCMSKGASLGVVIMPYYANKSFDSFLETYTGRDKARLVKIIISHVVANLFKAYVKKGFSHGDLFPKNVVLDTEYQPILIDFEKSAFNANHMQFWRDLDDFMGSVARTIFPELDDISRSHVVMNQAYNRKPDKTNILALLVAIRNM